MNDILLDEKLWGLKCIKEFSPRFTSSFTGVCESRFIVDIGEKFRVHDKSDDMWEVSYNNDRLFWTDIEQIKENCISISSKDLQ